jgi:hypothetical protein
VKNGRGLRIGFPDIIPFERNDVLEDLKSLVDVHRITDFTLHDRVVPTVELRRAEDELIISFLAVSPVAGGNNSLVQWFNASTTANLRPLAIHFGSAAGTAVGMYHRTVQEGGAQQTGFTTDRRKSGLSIPPSVAGGYTIFNQVGITGAIFFQMSQAAGLSRDVPKELLEKIVLPPGTGINFAPSGVTQDISVNVTYKVQAINPTRPAGV